MFQSATITKALKKTVLTSIGGARLTVHPTVFHPKHDRSSGFLAKYLRTLDLTGKQVLDCGTGTGILAIVAAQRGAEVTAIDINDLALDAARENAERNGVTIRLMKSDWFSALGDETFHLIVCNPPSVDGPHDHVHSSAWHAGVDHEHVRAFVSECAGHLAPGGALLLVLSRHADVDWWTGALAAGGLRGTPVARKQSWFEEIVIFRFSA